jgi:hypothetical protein
MAHKIPEILIIFSLHINYLCFKPCQYITKVAPLSIFKGDVDVHMTESQKSRLQFVTRYEKWDCHQPTEMQLVTGNLSMLPRHCTHASAPWHSCAWSWLFLSSVLVSPYLPLCVSKCTAEGRSERDRNSIHFLYWALCQLSSLHLPSYRML